MIVKNVYRKLETSTQKQFKKDYNKKITNFGCLLKQQTTQDKKIAQCK